VDIAALLLWLVTAGAGLYLLVSGRPASPSDQSAEAPEPATVPASGPVQSGLPQATVDALAAGARIPPITHTRVTTPPGQHPLLEFMHPALGVIGLGAWIAFVVTGFHAFAWIAFGVLLATITAGLTWYTINARLAAARPANRAADSEAGSGSGAQPAPTGRRYPPRRILIHGGAASTTLILALITLLITIHH
jgi:hypothetical protein